jgi:hypothetical protein
MKQYYRSLILLSLALTSNVAVAGWNQQCLNDCFNSNHACNYCDYQCRTEETPSRFEDNSNEYKCPF